VLRPASDTEACARLLAEDFWNGTSLERLQPSAAVDVLAMAIAARPAHTIQHRPLMV
jgi:anti-sigma-K factor RskA